MKTIDTLIRINSLELDGLRKMLVACEEEREKLIYYNNQMEDELEKEHQLAAKDTAMGIMFANYKRMIRDRQNTIVKSLHDLEKRLESLKEEIAIKFGEVKKYEILRENMLAEQQRQEVISETKQLDEIAINNYLKE